ncbi:FAD-dependent oxidoreductase [bacterium]|nr:FAD-dependent oxidoreductase [bacterium]
MSDEKPIQYRTLQEMPETIISEASMLWNKTGTWRYLRPKYQNQVPPCNQGCPAGNDVEGLMRLLEKGELKKALHLIREESPFPAVCGRVCYHPCETVCNRSRFDDPIAIHTLERIAGDQALRIIAPEKIRPDSGKTVAIIGAGPSGLTAAYHLARMGHQPTIFEALEKPGGLLKYGIPEYRLPREILNAEIDNIVSNGVEIRCGVKVGADMPWSDLAKFDAVFISIGGHRSRRLGIPSENATGVLGGLDYLKQVSDGQSPDLGTKTIVIGGGNSAIDSARCALRLGSQVSICYQRSRNEMPAFAEEVNEALKEGVQISFLTQPVRILTRKNRVTGVQFRKTKLGAPDASGRRRPEPVPDSEFTIPTDSVITAIGESTDLDWLPPEIECTGNMIAVNPWGQTSQKNVFAGGDAALSVHNVAAAIGSGKTAACAIDAFFNDLDLETIKSRISIGETGTLSVSRYLQSGNAHLQQADSGKTAVFENLNTHYFTKAARQKIKTLGIARRMTGFDEVNSGLDLDSAVIEAKRCFHCGVCTQCDNCYMFCPDIAVLKNKPGENGYQIALDYCKGCGICVNECPRAAMIMEEEQ